MSFTITHALTEARLDPVDARALLRHVLAVDDAYLITHSGQALSEAQRARFAALAARRSAGEPVAYIVGAREFFSLEFKVTPAVLIPRPETEALVEFALERIAPDSVQSVLDLGTGSGCIAISIARHRPHARVIAVDSSTAALAVARENASRLLRGLSKTPSPLMGEGWDGGAALPQHDSATLPLEGGGNPNVSFVLSDWFGALADRKFDLIVANPPYVAAGDPHLAQGDLRFEPSGALAAGADGLDCVRLIIASAPQYLSGGGWLAFEHGYDQAARCRELLAKAGFGEVFSRADVAGIERISGGVWSARGLRIQNATMEHDLSAACAPVRSHPRKRGASQGGRGAPLGI